MKRTELKRTAFKPKPVTFGAVRATGKPRQKAMKKSRPKMTPIRKSAKGEECTLRFPGICNGDTETTVWCHANSYDAGKGMGLKSRDEEGCYGCFACHAHLDGGYANTEMPRSTVDAFFDLARSVSQQILKQKGLMK